MKINKIDELINKEDVKIVLYKDDNEDFVSLLITNKDYTSSRKIEHNNLSFLRELKSLDIKFYGDEYICEQEVDRCELKKELENRNFLVVMGEDY